MLNHPTKDGYEITGAPALLVPLFWFAWFVVPEALIGATLGKRILGLRVRRLDGGKLGLGSAFLRRACDLFDFWMSFGLVATVCHLKGASGQRVGDMAAGAVVVLSKREWIEVLRCATAHKLWYRVSLVGYAQRDSLSPPLAISKIGARGVADPGLDGSGPIEFWEILSITFPRGYRNQQLDAFVIAVSALGKVPIEVTDAEVTILGYTKKSPTPRVLFRRSPKQDTC